MVLKADSCLWKIPIGKIRIFAFVFFACFLNAHIYAVGISDMSEEAENDLEWIAYHINWAQEGPERMDGFSWTPSFPLGHFQEFAVRNNGEAPHTVRFSVWYQYPEDVAREFLFMVNGVFVEQRFQAANDDYLHTTVYYDVVLPPREETRIRVHEVLSQASP